MRFHNFTYENGVRANFNSMNYLTFQIKRTFGNQRSSINLTIKNIEEFRFIIIPAGINSAKDSFFSKILAGNIYRKGIMLNYALVSVSLRADCHRNSWRIRTSNSYPTSRHKIGFTVYQRTNKHCRIGEHNGTWSEFNFCHLINWISYRHDMF